MTDHIAADQSGVDEAIRGIKRDGLYQTISDKIGGDAFDEIRAELDALSSNAAQSAGQEPVAWLTHHVDSSFTQGSFSFHDTTNALSPSGKFVCIPLYTHPSSAAQVEEIRNAAYELAATACESEGRNTNKLDGDSFYIALGQAAAAIRALKTAAPSKGEE